MRYYLGIDGGGTKTTSAIGDETQTLATAAAGPSNIIRVGELEARESLEESVREACAAAAIDPAQISGTCIGAAGAARPEIAATLRGILANIVTTTVSVVGDMEIALEAAFGSGPGVAVIAGTGSIAYGRNARGNTSRAGGWGFAISDEGSAHWIGRVTVSAVLRAADQQEIATFEKSPFPASLMRTWGVISLLDLARAANSVPPPDFAALFPALASSKDQMANEVLSKAGTELAQMAAIVVGRLFPADDASLVPVAMAGGVFRHAQRVREHFYNELRRLDSRVRINPQLIEPVEGALRMARRAAVRDDS